jgi:hypothetical protein
VSLEDVGSVTVGQSAVFRRMGWFVQSGRFRSRQLWMLPSGLYGATLLRLSAR